MLGADQVQRDRQEVRNGVLTSVVIHVIALFLLGWWLGADAAMAAMLRELRVAAARRKEEPKVSMIYPMQVMLEKPQELRPTLGMKPIVASNVRAPESAKPVRADFQSDRNTKAASTLAAAPDGLEAVPTSRGTGSSPMVFTQSEASNPDAQPTVSQLSPREPSALPVMQEKQKAPGVAEMIEDLERASTAKQMVSDSTLPFEVKKPQQAAPDGAPAMTTADAGFTPMSRAGEVKGTVTERGADSVNAEASPAGVYGAAQNQILARSWTRATLGKQLPPSRVTLHFFINAMGKVEEPEVLAKHGPDALVDLALETALGAQFEKPSPQVLAVYADARVPMNYEFTLD
jgi:hypothetical protein